MSKDLDRRVEALEQSQAPTEGVIHVVQLVSMGGNNREESMRATMAGCALDRWPTESEEEFLQRVKREAVSRSRPGYTVVAIACPGRTT